MTAELAAAALDLGLPPHGDTSLAHRFDRALALSAAARWDEADRLLHQLEVAGYRPRRGVAASASLTFYRVRCRLHLGRQAGLGEMLDRAGREAPGDVRVLALAAEWHAARGDREAALALVAEAEALHDPFTLALARAEALLDLGRRKAALERLADLGDALPRWTRPAATAATITRGRFDAESR